MALQQHVTRRLIANGHVFPRHAHAGWSLGIVRAGEGSFRCSGTTYTGGPGAISVLYPGESHDGWVHREKGLDYLVIELPEDTVATIVDGYRGTPSFPSRVVDDGPCAAALRAAHELRSTVDDVAAESAMALALARLYRRHSRHRLGDPGAGPSAMVRRVRGYLDEHAADAVTLDELARLASVSTPTLVRRFRAEVGMPPHAYLISRRVEIARALLLNGAPVALAAATAGFSDQSHLARHFTRIIGVTPGRFRVAR